VEETGKTGGRGNMLENQEGPTLSTGEETSRPDLNPPGVWGGEHERE